MQRWPELLLFAFLLPTMAAWAADKEKEDDGPRFDPVVPINQKVKGMHLPYYAPNGRLRMQFDADGAVRSDATSILLEKLRIQSFDERGKSDMIVLFPTATYNLSSNIITSKDRVVVRRNDFELTGTGMEFDTKNKSGRLFSKIRMEIFSTDPNTPTPAIPSKNGK